VEVRGLIRPSTGGSTRRLAMSITIRAVTTMPAPVLAMADRQMDSAITLAQPLPPMTWAT
jgi:hypothetical protein